MVWHSIHCIATMSCAFSVSLALSWLLLLLLFMAPYYWPQAQKAQQLHEERAAMAKSLAENEANIKAKKQAAKQQVRSAALSGLAANQGILCLHNHNSSHPDSDMSSSCDYMHGSQ